MKRNRGFTIVEVVVAVAIIVMITAVSIPRYVSYNRRIEFATTVQGLVDCIRTAQQTAATPTFAQYRYVSAELTKASSPEGVTCLVRGLGLRDISGQEVSVQDLKALPTRLDNGSTTITPATTLAITMSSVSNSTTPISIANPISTRIFFGGGERGVPVLLCTNLAPTTGCSNPITASALGNGFSTDIALTNPSNADTKGTLSIGALGLPITYESSAN